MIAKQVLYHGKATLVCDGKCSKAWGHNGRPRKMLSDDEDDYVYLPDSELGTAPGPTETVCIEEGPDAKPSAVDHNNGECMNKWCARECERCARLEGWAPNMNKPQPNIRRGEPL